MAGSVESWPDRMWGMSLGRKLILLLSLLVAGGSGGFWVLSTPANPLTAFFRSPISDLSQRVVVGPYPTEGDFIALQRNHIETIVTLLDPSLPYERVALYSEIALASRYNMRVLNFPMASVLGQTMGDYYVQNAHAAAEAIARMPGKVYLHCYLGVHRTATVRNLLQTKGVLVANDFNRKKPSDDELLWQDAQADYALGRFQEALEKIQKIKKPDAAVRNLQAWSTYKLGDAAKSQSMFQALVAEKDNFDARMGFGYSAMRQNDLRTAGEQFTAALKMTPDSEAALAGMGMVRYREGKSAEACDYLEGALQLDSGRDQDARDIYGRLNCSRLSGAKQKP
jgi:tetratricopeptide (TPR) repeat protein